MATTTPNFGWPVPTSTDYVKDGATAIEALGDAIDATVAGLGSGLKFITTQSFTTSSAINVNNCFSSTYTNYKILVNATGSATGNLNMRMRVGGVDNSGSIYSRQFLRAISSTVSGSYDTLTETNVGDVATTTTNLCVVEVFNPALAAKTRIAANFSGGGVNYVGLFYTLHDTATAYDGFSLIPSSGTVTGNLWVYGYQKA